MSLQQNSPETIVGNSKKVMGESECNTKIRVFWPNPLAFYNTGDKFDLISALYEVDVIEVDDPIYHQLVFTDKTGMRHRFNGLAYHIMEQRVPCGEVDAAL